jgi:hypothetical protein
MATPYPNLTPSQLENNITQLIRDYQRQKDTRLLARMALHIVELRARHHLENGTPDWAGRSSEYRSTIADIYTRAGIDDAGRNRVQGSARYHVGNALRDYAPHHELAAAGLMTTSPKGRVQTDRAAANALREQVLNGDNPLTLAQGAARLLERLDTDDVLVDDYHALERTLQAIRGRAHHLLDSI